MAGAKKRIKYIDMVKGFAILSIVVSHAFDYGLDKFFSGNVNRGNYVTLILGVFFLTSGYFYTQGKRTVGESIQSRVKSVVVPFWTYLLTVSALDFLRIGIFEKKWEPVTFLRGIVAGIWGSTRTPFEVPFIGLTKWKDGIVSVLVSRTAPFWYLPALFVGSVISFIIIEKLYKRDDKKTLIAVIVSFVPLMLVSFIDKNLLKTWQLPWAICAGSIAAILLVCGFLVKESGVLKREETSFSCIVMVAGFVVAAVYLVFNSYLAAFVYADFGEGLAFGNIAFYLIGSIGLFWFLASFFKLIEDKITIVSGLFSRLGEMSLYIFVFHYLIIRFLDDIFVAVLPSVAESVQNSTTSRVVVCTVYVILSTVISYFVGMGITKLKKAKKAQ